jgi:hypothetical protein
MTSTMWIAAPTGVSGAGGAAVRPDAVIERPLAARLRAVPLTAVVAGPRAGVRVLGAPVCGTAPFAGLVPTHRSTGYVRTPDAFGPMNDQQDNGTTLGIHSSGRPRS